MGVKGKNTEGLWAAISKMQNLRKKQKKAKLLDRHEKGHDNKTKLLN